jgi:hypothetical protein
VCTAAPRWNVLALANQRHAGYPVRVHKRRATVKYMFHNPDDVRWFRPVELYTREGRRGRITEPLGARGCDACALKALCIKVV